MEAIANKKFTRLLLGFVLIALLSVALLGMPPTMMGMEMNNNGQMGGCPFSGVAIICKMSPLEHIMAWQKMFTTLPSKNISMLAALLLLAVFSILFLRDLWSKNSLRVVSIQRQRFRYDAQILQNKFQEAFSNGIINPKVF